MKPVVKHLNSEGLLSGLTLGFRRSGFETSITFLVGMSGFGASITETGGQVLKCTITYMYIMNYVVIA